MKKSRSKGTNTSPLMVTRQTRRDVLRTLASITASSVIACGPRDDAEEDVGEASSALLGISTFLHEPAKRTYVADWLQAYGPKSVLAGGQIQFGVSATVPYTLKIMRLGWDINGARDLDFATVSTNAAPVQRWVNKGSYIFVEKAFPTTAISAWTLECWVRPCSNGNSALRRQGILTQYSEPNGCGIGLFLGSGLIPQCYFGTGTSYNANYLLSGSTPLSGAWHHLVATCSGGTARLFVDGVLVKERQLMPTLVAPGATPICIGSYAENGYADHTLDADVAMPAIYSRAFAYDPAQPNTINEALDRYKWVTSGPTRKEPAIPNGPSVEAYWKLTEEQGTSVADSGGNQRTGTIANLGTWMIGGPSFDATYTASASNIKGHALRLSQTDLYDCGWTQSPPIANNTWTVPADAPPGMYVARFTAASHPEGYDVPFVVRKASSKPSARVAVLSNTNTWQAYRNTDQVSPAFQPDIPDFYGWQADGVPPYKVGGNLPHRSATGVVSNDPGLGFGHLVRAERPLHVWLEQEGVDYDLVSDLELSQSASLLSQYKLLFIVGHAEYWSQDAYDHVMAFLDAGGSVICAAGNAIFWRVSHLPNNVLECRKLGMYMFLPGEADHEADGKRGGLFRQIGWPGSALVGLETVGTGGPTFVPIQALPAALNHPIFNQPEAAGVSAGEALGGAFATGSEFDALANNVLGCPLPTIPGITTLAQATIVDQHALWAWDGHTIAPSDSPTNVAGQWIYWPRVPGGRVFSTGSIATARGLLDLDGTTGDGGAKMGRIFRNTMHGMGVKHRMCILGVSTANQLMMSTFNPDGGADASGMFANFSYVDTGFSSLAAAGAMWAPNLLGVSAVNSAGQLCYYCFDVSSGTPTPIASNNFGGTYTGRPAMLAWGRNRLNILVRGTDNHLYEIRWDGSAWLPRRDLGGNVTTSPAACVQEGRRIGVAIINNVGNLLYNYSVNDTWVGWEDFGGGQFNRTPSIHAWGGNRVSLFAVDGSGNVKYKVWPGAGYWLPLNSWETIGTSIGSRVAVASFSPTSFTMLAKTFNNRVFTNYCADGDANGGLGAWGPGFFDFGMATNDEPVLATFRGRSLTAVARGTDSRYYFRFWRDGSGWTAWSSFANTFQSPPAIFSFVSG